jgi:hypothetical protein
MTEKEKGRFCGACAKVVVDFTAMSDEEIVEYLQQHTKQKTCGHFRNEQLLQNENIKIDLEKLPKNISFRSMLAVCLISIFSSIFFISCNSSKHIKGKILIHEPKSTKAQQREIGELIKNGKMGKVKLPKK